MIQGSERPNGEGVRGSLWLLLIGEATELPEARVLSLGSPTRPRRQKHMSRERRLRGGRGGPAERHPRRMGNSS